MNDDDLDAKIRRLVRAVAEAAPEVPPPPDVGDSAVGARSSSVSGSQRERVRRQATGARLFGVVVAVVAVVIAGALALIVDPWGGRSDRVETAGPGELVRHEVIVYAQEYEVDCPVGEPELAGSFDEMTFEAWGSEQLGRYRHTVRYPDGATRSVVSEGVPWQPKAVFTDGVVAGRAVSCEGIGVLVSEPGQGAVFSLNPLTSDASARELTVPAYGYRAELVGDGVDALGRVGELWRRESRALTVLDGQQVSIDETSEWVIEAGSGQALERRQHDELAGVGRISWRATLVRSDQVPLTDDLFDTAGMKPISGGSDGSAVATTLVEEPGPPPPLPVVMEPGSEVLPQSLVGPGQELARSAHVARVTTGDGAFDLFAYDVTDAATGTTSRCTAVRSPVVSGSTCGPLVDAGTPTEVVRSVYTEGDRAVVTIAAPAETERVELHLATHTVDVVPIEGWGVVPVPANEACPTFTATAHLQDGTSITAPSPTPCF